MAPYRGDVSREEIGGCSVRNSPNQRRGTGQIRELGHADVPRNRELLAKYRDLPMELDDAALVRVAERDRIGRDFGIYRPARIGGFHIVREVKFPVFLYRFCTITRLHLADFGLHDGAL